MNLELLLRTTNVVFHVGAARIEPTFAELWKSVGINGHALGNRSAVMWAISR